MSEHVGIENIGFYTPNAAIDLVELAKHTKQNPDKFTRGLGQLKMSVVTPDQDVISMAANAAKQILTEDIIDKIDLVLFATESAIDVSLDTDSYILTALDDEVDMRIIVHTELW